MIKAVCRKAIFFYKRHLSPSIGRECIYTPTCSMYTLDAIEKYGALRGIFMGILRILRCNPFAKGGFDPVKENLRGSAKWTL
ncbi:MAG TPA: membrane protein insertion efficiency factor YidD [Clostridia bacterium]|nr:membrane protein insertion efficiency factor YidD [Clostridia bacterium]